MASTPFTDAAIMALLRRFNPWWSGGYPAALPAARRSVFQTLWERVYAQDGPPVLLLSGPRGAGKTTLLQQLAAELLKSGAPPLYVLYAPIEHPLFKLAGLEAIMRAWSAATPKAGDTLYLLLDEIEYAKNWEAWLAHHARAGLKCRIIAAASVLPPAEKANAESPWPVLRISSLLFADYLRLQNALPRGLPSGQNLRELFAWDAGAFEAVAVAAYPLAAQFHDYLLRGGFPGVSFQRELASVQADLRGVIIDRILKGDLAAIYGVRSIAELEHLYLELCAHDGEPVDILELSERLGVSKNTVRKHLELLASAHLICQTPQFGYGSEVLRGHMKICLSDPALGFAMHARGREALEDDARMLGAAESCVFKHLYARDAWGGPAYSYWRLRTGEHVSFIATGGAGKSRPFHVVEGDNGLDPAALAGLRRFCADKQVPMAYVITRRLDDFGPAALPGPGRASKEKLATQCMRIPAALFCYWMS